jgi:ABC-type multidrug transport system fused ATPase/permease subunit
MLKTGLKVRAAMMGSVIEKMMRLSSLGMGTIGAGMINNLAANDTEQILVSMPIIANVFFAPVMIVVSMTLLAMTVGASFLGGFGAMIFVLVCCFKVVGKQVKYKKLQLEAADNRVKLTNELLGGVRIVKAYGWEQPFEKEVMKLRKIETYYLKLQAIFISLVVVVILCSPVVLAVVTFSIYAATGNEMKPSTIFTAVALLNLIRFPMGFLPFGIAQAVKIALSLARLQRMLEAHESEAPAIEPQENSDTAAPLCIADAEFGYPLADDDEAGKGKGKGKKRGCCGCLGKMMAGKGKGKGKGKDKSPVAEQKLERPEDID